MVNLLFFTSELLTWGYKIKNFTSGYLLDGKIFMFSLLSYEPEVDKWKKFVKCYSFNVREPLEIDTAP